MFYTIVLSVLMMNQEPRTLPGTELQCSAPRQLATDYKATVRYCTKGATK